MTQAVEAPHAADLFDFPRVEGERPKAPPRASAAFKTVPPEREQRDRIRAAAAEFAPSLDRSKPFTRPQLQAMGEEMLRRLDTPEEYLGFTMVCIANEFWREQVQAIAVQPPAAAAAALPQERRGLPGRLRRVRPRLPQVRRLLRRRLQDARPRTSATRCSSPKGTPIVLKIIVSGHVDAIVGVACLNVLEKAIDKILLAGIPCVAAPLLSSNCKSTSVDDDWVFEMINLQTPPPEAHDEDLRPPDAGGAPALRGAGTVAPGAAHPGRSRGEPHDPLARARSHRLRLAGAGRQALAAVHHAGRLRRPEGRPGHAARPTGSTCPTRSSGRPWPSRRSTRPRSSTTTSRTTTPSATAGRRCTASTASARPSTSATT